MVMTPSSTRLLCSDFKGPNVHAIKVVIRNRLMPYNGMSSEIRRATSSSKERCE